MPENNQHSTTDRHQDTAETINELTPSISDHKPESDNTHIPKKTIRHLQAPEPVSIPPTPEFMTPEQTPQTWMHANFAMMKTT